MQLPSERACHDYVHCRPDLTRQTQPLPASRTPWPCLSAGVPSSFDAAQRAWQPSRPATGAARAACRCRTPRRLRRRGGGTPLPKPPPSHAVRVDSPASSHPASLTCGIAQLSRSWRKQTGCPAAQHATRMWSPSRCSCSTTRRRAPPRALSPPHPEPSDRPLLRQMLGLHAFPALRRLFVAQQSLSRLQGLEACPLLEARP